MRLINLFHKKFNFMDFVFRFQATASDWAVLEWPFPLIHTQYLPSPFLVAPAQ